MRMRTVALFVSFGLTLFTAVCLPSAKADDRPVWSPAVIALGDQREQLLSTPIHQRPNRPLHIYGNTVRRNYYYGSPLPRLAPNRARILPPIFAVPR